MNIYCIKNKKIVSSAFSKFSLLENKLLNLVLIRELLWQVELFKIK